MSRSVPIILSLVEIFTYYSSIILNSFGYLLFSKLCWHNPSRPTIVIRRLSWILCYFYEVIPHRYSHNKDHFPFSQNMREIIKGRYYIIIIIASRAVSVAFGRGRAIRGTLFSDYCLFLRLLL